MQLSDIVSIRKWVDENPTHPEFQNICDELALLECLDKQLHHHDTLEGAMDWWNSMDPLEKLEVSLHLQLNWKTDKPFNFEEALMALVKKAMDDYRRDNPDNPHFDENYDCPADREIKAKMQPSYEIINNLLNHGKEHRRHQSDVGKTNSQGRIG